MNNKLYLFAGTIDLQFERNFANWQQTYKGSFFVLAMDGLANAIFDLTSTCQWIRVFHNDPLDDRLRHKSVIFLHIKTYSDWRDWKIALIHELYVEVFDSLKAKGLEIELSQKDIYSDERFNHPTILGLSE